MKSLVMESLAMLRAVARSADKSGLAEEAAETEPVEEEERVLASETGGTGAEATVGGTGTSATLAAGFFPLFSSHLMQVRQVS